jgi:hypothetical protein
VIRIASDWHLGPRSPALHGRRAAAFLRGAAADGADVILNGDVFDDLFSGRGAGERAHPEVVAAMDALAREGRLRRTRGNHDPGQGEARVVLEWPGVGRVLVTHGDLVDPVHRSFAGRVGARLALRLGHLAAVRGVVRAVARLGEAFAGAAAGGGMVALFRARCQRLVADEGCALGVFGHVHVAHLVPGDAYANSGALDDDGLHYLELGPEGARLRVWTAEPRADDPAAAPHGSARARGEGEAREEGMDDRGDR